MIKSLYGLFGHPLFQAAVLEKIIRGVVIFFGSWTLYTQAMVYSGQSFHTLSSFLPLWLILTAASIFFLVRSSGSGERPALAHRTGFVHPRWVKSPWFHLVSLALIGTSCLVVSWGFLSWSLSFVYLTIAGYYRQVDPSPERSKGTLPEESNGTVNTGEMILLVMVILAGWWLNSLFAERSLDEGYFINSIIQTVDHPDLPLLSFDGMGGDLNAFTSGEVSRRVPAALRGLLSGEVADLFYVVVHRPQSFELLGATTHHLTGVSQHTIYYLLFPYFFIAFLFLVVFFLAKRFLGRYAWAVLVILLLMAFLEAGGSRFYGKYLVIRVAQGKYLLFALIPPLLFYFIRSYMLNGGYKQAAIVMFTLVFATGLSSSGLFTGLIGFTVFTLSSFSWSRRGLFQTARLLPALVPVLVVLFFFILEMRNYTGGREEGVTRDYTYVLGSGVVPAIFLTFLVAVPYLAGRLGLLERGYLSRSVYYSVLLVLNPLTGWFLGEYFFMALSFRLLWSLPLVFFSALGSVLAGVFIYRKIEKPGLKIFFSGALIVIFLAVIFTRMDRVQIMAQKNKARERAIIETVMAIRENSGPGDLVLSNERVATVMTTYRNMPPSVVIRKRYLEQRRPNLEKRVFTDTSFLYYLINNKGRADSRAGFYENLPRVKHIMNDLGVTMVVLKRSDKNFSYFSEWLVSIQFQPVYENATFSLYRRTL